MIVVTCIFCQRALRIGEGCDCRRLSNFGEVVLTAAAIDGRKTGAIDGDAMKRAADARRERPS